MAFNDLFVMKKMVVTRILLLFIALVSHSVVLNAQNEMNRYHGLTEKQRSIVQIAALTAQGGLHALKPALNKALDAGLTVNEIKEVLVHCYAYCGFPRSIRGLQTFMEVLDERKAGGIIDITGAGASPINNETSKYQRGKNVLSKLTQTTQDMPLSDYGAFAPVIDTFLKEHLFADLFERDVLTYSERELVTISVLNTIGGAEPMLRSHVKICSNLGLTPEQLNEFTEIIHAIIPNDSGFSAGQLVKSPNFTGAVWLNMMGAGDSTLHASSGHVTFEPGARTNWHSHPGGQILFITEGKGYYQVKGQPARLLKKGDYVEIPINAMHWHGAAPDSRLSHIAVSLNTDKGGAVWYGPVTDEEYEKCAIKFDLK